MKARAVFLDKDGTLVADVPYNVDPERMRLTPWAGVGLRALHAAGYALIVVSNQSGVARGYFSEAALGAVEEGLRRLLGDEGVPLAGFYYCPHHPEGKVAPYGTACSCRKPEPGLILRAAEDHGIDLAGSWLIGDILDDVEAGRRAGCRTILVDNGSETEWELHPGRVPHAIVADLDEAARTVLGRSGGLPLMPGRADDGPPQPRQHARSLPQVMASIRGARVLVLGDAMLDVYVTGTASRLCQEAPVPVVSVCRSGEAPGGAANVAANAVALGARVRLLSVVGDDDEGRRLTRLLKARGIGGDGLVVEPGRRTLTKMRVMAADHMLVRVDQGTTSGMDAAAEARLIELLPEAFASCDVAVVSDYGYGVLTRAVLRALGSLQGAEPRVLGVDAKDLGRYRGMDVTVVKPNHAQALALLGRPEPASGANRARWMLQQGEPLLDACSAHVVAVTLDSEGALVFERGRSPYRTYARPHAQVQAAGAGDTFLTALTLSLGTGADVPSAAELASAAAAVVMGKEGTATCSAGEVREAISAGGKVLAPEHVVARMDSHRSQGRRIVFTNGCFDILHRGHTTYLNRAKSLGDVLVVGVNDDAGVRRLKGSGRPVNPLEDRIEVLAALSCVDHVVAFEEPEPSRLIRQVRPHVFVKGGDYTRDRLPEAAVVEELGGRVEILPYERDRSTTGVIERIRRSPGGAVPVPDPEPSPAG